MTPSAAIILHIAIGSFALFAYWAALLARKGKPVHRLAGKIGLLSLAFVGLSTGPVLFTRPGPFDPGWVVQMVYLTLCLCSVSMISFTAIRFRASPARFRSKSFCVLGYVLLVMGLVVLVAGLAKADLIAIILSWVGLVFGSAMIAFVRFKGELHPRWWLGWHLNANCALFNAVNGTFMFVAARWIGLTDDSIVAQAGFQVLTIAIALWLRLWFGARYGAPLRFGAQPPRRAMTPT